MKTKISQIEDNYVLDEFLPKIGTAIFVLFILIFIAGLTIGTKGLISVANAQEFDPKYNPPKNEKIVFGERLVQELQKIPVDTDQTIILAKNLISKYEGLHLEAYLDTYGWAICYGNRSEKGATTTKEDCEQRLTNRILVLKDYVEARYTGLTSNQKAALISLYYNVHNPIHVEWRINTGQSERSVRNIWVAYHLADGKPLRGLKKRRVEEVNLFFNL